MAAANIKFIEDGFGVRYTSGPHGFDVDYDGFVTRVSCVTGPIVFTTEVGVVVNEKYASLQQIAQDVEDIKRSLAQFVANLSAPPAT